MQNFKNLLVWQKAHELALLTYRVTADFPRDELFGPRNSLRKTSVDIPAHIAEGCGKLDSPETGKVLSEQSPSRIGSNTMHSWLEIFEC